MLRDFLEARVNMVRARLAHLARMLCLVALNFRLLATPFLPGDCQSPGLYTDVVSGSVQESLKERATVVLSDGWLC